MADGLGAAGSSKYLRDKDEVNKDLINSERKILEGQHQFTRIFPKEHAKYSQEEIQENNRIAELHKYLDKTPDLGDHDNQPDPRTSGQSINNESKQSV